MLCYELDCRELNGKECSHYPWEFMELVTERCYCPFVNKPRKVIEKTKVRMTTQKVKTKK